MSWNIEKDFGKFVIDKLNKEGMHVMRIESASTITGCPDMYVHGAGDDYFIELKNVKQNINDSVKVPWRPGQQAWAVQYALSHTSSMDRYTYKVKHSWTFLATSNKVLLIRMDAYISSSIIYTAMTNVYEYNIDEFKCMSIKTFLQMYTYTVQVNMKKYLARRPSGTVPYIELVAHYLDKYLQIHMGYEYEPIDVFMPELEDEDIIITQDNSNKLIPHNSLIDNVYSAVLSWRLNEQSKQE